jgi:hypothetical protein
MGASTKRRPRPRVLVGSVDWFVAPLHQPLLGISDQLVWVLIYLLLVFGVLVAFVCRACTFVHEAGMSSCEIAFRAAICLPVTDRESTAPCASQSQTHRPRVCLMLPIITCHQARHDSVVHSAPMYLTAPSFWAHHSSILGRTHRGIFVEGIPLYEMACTSTLILHVHRLSSAFGAWRECADAASAGSSGGVLAIWSMYGRHQD